MHDRLATWTYAHRTKPGTRELILKRARPGAGMAHEFRAERVSRGDDGNPLREQPGTSLYDHVNRGVKEAAIDWLSVQHQGLMAAGWQLMHAEGEAESIDLGAQQVAA